MSQRSPVVWSQGMFLQPHHFQQQARHVEHLVDVRVRSAHPHAWGFSELVLDEASLALGRVGVLRASGVLPDGTPFSIPGLDAAPPALETSLGLKNELVCLAAPIGRPGTTEVDFGDGPASELYRYRATQEELRDSANAADDPEAIQTGALALRLLPAADLSDAHAMLGVARVLERRSDGQVVLDRSYIAPQTRLDATAQLSANAQLLHGLIRQRGRLLASRMGQLGNGVSEVSDFLMLQTLNRAEPVFRQHAGAPVAHPQSFHFACLQLAGELATFASETRVATEFPLYRHTELGPTFDPLVLALRRMLSTLIERNVLQIEFVERNHGVRTAVLPEPDMARSASFVLAVNAQMPSELLRQRFPLQSKLGPVDKLRDLVNLALPGVALRLLPTAPRQLPFHAGFHYFEVDRGAELWKEIARNGSLALFATSDFPGIELELWAIRQ